MRFGIVLIMVLGLTVNAGAYAKENKKPTPAPKAESKQATTLQIRPVYEVDGSFGFCLGDWKYPDGRDITFALSVEKQLNIGLHIPQGGFKIGGKYDLSVSLDEAEGRRVRAEALDEETLLLQMGVNPTFFKKLRAAKTLSAGAAGKVIAFDLPAMDESLKHLEQCLKDKAGTRNEKIAKMEKALPQTLKALLVTAGFTDIIPIPLDKVPVEQRPADFMWQTGDLVAGVRERAAPAGKSLSDLIGLHMQGLKEKCEGAFRADLQREQNVNGLVMRQAMASCVPEKGDEAQGLVVSILFYMTPKGGFTSFTHEAPIQAKEQAKVASDRLAQTLAKLARE